MPTKGEFVLIDGKVGIIVETRKSSADIWFGETPRDPLNQYAIITNVSLDQIPTKLVTRATDAKIYIDEEMPPDVSASVATT